MIRLITLLGLLPGGLRLQLASFQRPIDASEAAFAACDGERFKHPEADRLAGHRDAKRMDDLADLDLFGLNKVV